MRGRLEVSPYLPLYVLPGHRVTNARQAASATRRERALWQHAACQLLERDRAEPDGA